MFNDSCFLSLIAKLGKKDGTGIVCSQITLLTGGLYDDGLPGRITIFRVMRLFADNSYMAMQTSGKSCWSFYCLRFKLFYLFLGIVKYLYVAENSKNDFSDVYRFSFDTVAVIHLIMNIFLLAHYTYRI